MTMDETLENYLANHAITYTIHEHPAIFTVAEGRRLKEHIPGMHCKTLFLKDDEGKFYLVGMRADKRLVITKLRKQFGLKKLFFGSVDELKERLRLTPGSVSIFGMIHDTSHHVHLILDIEVWHAPIVGFHPNINTVTLEISHENLVKFYESIKGRKELLDL